MLTDALRTLSAPPSAGEKKQALADVNAKIAALESQLGIKARLMPIFNADRAVKRLTELLAQLAAKSPAGTPAAASPAVAAAAAAIADAPDAAGTLTASLAEFHKMDAATRTQFAADGGALSKSDFDKLTLSAKSKFCVAGGKILDDSPASKRTLSTAARSFGQS